MTDYRVQPVDEIVTHAERAEFAALQVVDLRQAAASVAQAYKNFVVFDVNDHCLRMAVMEGEFRWHQHPRSDECFLVLEGELEIDLAGGETIRLRPSQTYVLPAGVIHRTRSRGRCVNLCFESHAAYTDVLFAEPSED